MVVAVSNKHYVKKYLVEGSMGTSDPTATGAVLAVGVVGTA